MNKKVLLTLSALGIFTFSSQVLSPVLADTTQNPPTENSNYQLNKYDCYTDVLVQNTITVNDVKYTKDNKHFAFNNIKIRPNTDVTINIPVDYSISPRGDNVTQKQIDDYVTKNSATIIGDIALKNNGKLTKYTAQSTVHQAKGQTVLTFKFKANDLLRSSENIMMLTGNLNSPKASPLYRKNVLNFVTDNSPVSSSSSSTIKSSSSSNSSFVVKPNNSVSSSNSVAKSNVTVSSSSSSSSSSSTIKPSTKVSSSSSVVKPNNSVSSSSKSSLSSSSLNRAIKTDKTVSSSTKHLNDAMNNTNSSSQTINNSSNQSTKGHLPQTGEQKQGVLAVLGTGLLGSLCLLIKKLVKKN